MIQSTLKFKLLGMKSMQKQPFENNNGKGANTGCQHILNFAQMIKNVLNTNLIIMRHSQDVIRKFC